MPRATITSVFQNDISAVFRRRHFLFALIRFAGGVRATIAPMDEFQAFEWGRLLIGEAPPLFLLEILLRTSVVFTFGAVMLRIIGKRGKRQMTPFEALIIIALGSAVGDVMFYPEVSLLHAALVILTVTVLTIGFDWLQYRSKHSRLLVNGTSRLVVKDGKLIADALAQENLSDEELFSLLREQGIADISEIARAYAELSGKISVFRTKDMENRKTGLLKDST